MTWRSATAVLVLTASGLCAAADARETEIDPVGIWNCLMYGPLGDQRFYLQLAEDQSTRMARVTEALQGRWAPLADWRRARGRLEFEDPWNRRRFSASLSGTDLGGTWSASPHAGGWWCVAVPNADRGDLRSPPAGRLMDAPVPAIMASPIYPRQAIREAKEGRAVSCFIVSGDGEISRPHVIESTDDVFREPTLIAVARSRYRSWGDEDAVVPACRSFTFELRAGGG